jgi:hypothetical protein
MERVPREAVKMKKYYKVENAHIEKGILHLRVNGNNIQRELKDVSPILSTANEVEQKEFEVSPSGYGIHWPLIDEDISIDGLLGIVHKPSTNRKIA